MHWLIVLQVWIYNSHLHIVPPEHVSPRTNAAPRRGYPGKREGFEDEGIEDDSKYITEQHAVDVLRNPSADTEASPEVEKAVWRRIAG